MTQARKTGLPSAIGGFVLLGLAKMIERMGDAMPGPTEGGNGERLVVYLIALAVLIVAAVLLIRGGRQAFRCIFGKYRQSDRDLANVFADTSAHVDAPAPFDPDAALARYMERKQAGTAPPSPAGFGRKGL